MSKVICKIPKGGYGLGNLLFPILRAYAFAQLNELPFTVSGFNYFRIGPYLRGDKYKRNYSGRFDLPKTSLKDIVDKVFRAGAVLITEPEVKPISKAEREGNKVYIFSTIPHWSDYFAGLRENRDIVVKKFRDMLSKDIRDDIEAKQETPTIGVHVRMGDFRKLKANEDFSKIGCARTPEEYFVDVINTIRRIHGSDLPVTVFTDGFRHEFEHLFNLKNIHMVEGNKDVVDMVLLSKSKIIVTSAGSTFSYWAAFLSDAPVILHPDHLYEPLRPATINAKSYEGPLNFDQPNELLVENIQSIKMLVGA